MLLNLSFDNPAPWYIFCDIDCSRQADSLCMVYVREQFSHLQPAWKLCTHLQDHCPWYNSAEAG